MSPRPADSLPPSSRPRLDIRQASSISHTPAPLPPVDRWDGEASDDPEIQAASAMHDAQFHLASAVALTVLLLSWALGRQQLPGADPFLGTPMMVLHLGAWMTAWMSFEGALTAHRLLAIVTDEDDEEHTFSLAIVASCTALLVLHTAMIIASVLH